jgi:hypothetical protein
MRFYRLYDVKADPEEMLRPENQRSTPWGGADEGRCDKCGGNGRTRYECRSCMETGARAECPACHGMVEGEDVCPACNGDGVIDRVERSGVSAFPSVDGLYRYIVECSGDFRDKVVVAVEGELSGDRDLDADMGAVLVVPDRIAAVGPVDWQLVDRLERRFR